jgi:hypothetical protein
MHAVSEVSEKIAHIDVLFLFGLFFLNLNLGGSLGTSSRGGDLGALGGLKGIQFISGFQSHGGDILEGVHQHMGHGQGNDITQFQRKGGQSTASFLELGDETFGVEVDDGLIQHASVVIDGDDFHTVREGIEVHLGQKGTFGGTDDLAGDQHLDFFLDFNHTLVDLGGDLEGMEERDLGGVHSGGSGGDDNLGVGDFSDLGGGLSTVGLDHGLEVEDTGVGEDDSELVGQVFFQDVEFGHGGSELVEVVEVLHVLVEGGGSQGKAFFDHGVLSDDEFGATGEEVTSDLLDLVGGHVVQ